MYGPYDEKLLPGVYHLAEWYGETNNVFSARALYQHAVNILQANSMQSSLDAIRAYQGIARTYRVERFPNFYTSGDGGSSQSSSFTPAYSNTLSVNNFPAGERALQQIIKIHRESENPDPKVVAEAMLELADWYLLFDKTRRAFPLYQHVYTLLAEAKGFAVEQYFAEPKLLYFPVPQDPRAPPLAVRGERQQGFVEVTYEVSTNGYAKSMKTVGSEPDGLMDFRVRKSLRLSRYRPALVDGVPMAKLDHTFRHVFGYFPKIAADDTDGSAKTAEGE